MTERPLALITGAAHGIGAATAAELARRGYDLALLDLDRNGLNRLVESLRGEGRRVRPLLVDLTDWDQVERATAPIAAEFGRIDLLVNNAAWRRVETMREVDLATWDKTLRVCLTAPAFLAKWAAEIMAPRRRGVIINVASIRADFPDGTCAAYVAAKGGLQSLSYELAALYGPAGIRVVSLNPGAIDTALSTDLAASDVLRDVLADCVDHTPLQRQGTPEEIARLIAWLASDEASFVTGTTITADGGLSRNGYGRQLKHRMKPGQF